jgi:hypothetical protein
MKFFSGWKEEVYLVRVKYYGQSYNSSGSNAMYIPDSLPPDDLTNIGDVRDIYSHPVDRVCSLRDLCLQSLAQYTVKLALQTSACGGVRPKIPWMMNFNLDRLHPMDKKYLEHYLHRKKQLTNPFVMRLLHSNVPNSKCLRASIDSREYIGLERETNEDWSKMFYYIQLGSLCTSSNNTDVEHVKTLINKVNRLRPKACVVYGNFSAHSPGDEGYVDEISSVRGALARISDSIPLVFVCGPNDVGLCDNNNVDNNSISVYHRYFGADYYGFWIAGMRGIVINSSLLIYADRYETSNTIRTNANAQIRWLEEEIEQCKLSANTVIVYSYHPWFIHNAEEDDSYIDEEKTLYR